MGARRLLRFGQLRGGQSKAADDSLAERVCALVGRVLDLPPNLRPAGPDMRLYGEGLGVDSLDVLRLVAALEEEFDLTIEDSALTPSTFESIQSIVCLVRRLSAAQ